MSSAPPPVLPPKKEVALALLRGPSVFVHLDPRKDGVVVPKWFKRQPQLVLQVGLNMPVPIPDLVVNDAGISCTLSFSRAPHWCDLPWAAVYALVGEDGRGMIWPEDLPPELATQVDRPKLAVVRTDKSPKRSRKPRARSQGDGDAAERAAPRPAKGAPRHGVKAAPDAPNEARAARAGRPLPPYLRVIK